MVHIKTIIKETKDIKNIFNYSYDFSILSKTRNILYGISIIFIMFFHTTIIIPKDNYFLIFIKSHGDIGVDVFLFLSGISLIYSYSKDENTSAFYTRRLQRVLIPTLMVSSVWFSGIFLNSKNIGMNTLKQYILNASLLSFWTNHVLTFWFISAIIVLYLFYPIIYKYFTKHNYSFLSLVILIVGFYFSWYLAKGNGFQIFFTPIFAYRVPSFLFGCWLGRMVKNNYTINLIKLIFILSTVITFVFLVNLFIGKYLHDQRTLYSLYCVCITIGMSIVIHWIINKKISKIFAFLGGFTLEIYLLHEKILGYLFKYYYIFPYRKVDPYRILLNIVAVIIAIILSIVFKYVCEKLISFYNSSTNNN